MERISRTDKEYSSFIIDIKQRIQSAQIKAAVSVNQELLRLYWELGAKIVGKQAQTSWGDGFLRQMSADLQKAFPDMKGFSYRNMRYIKQWYLFWSTETIVQQAVAQLAEQTDSIWQQAVAKLPEQANQIGQQAVAQLWQIPWGHNLVIMSKAENCQEALFYVRKTIENNWSRAVLTHQIEGRLFQREGQAVSNFEVSLPKPQSDLARQIIKDPYNFDFLTLREKHDERELESALMERVTQFLLELGAGFAFLGRQYKLTVGSEDFYIDLLFYHAKLHCYVVVELKTVKFKPEFAGKLNFYISAVDGILKIQGDNPTIGLLICKSKDKTVVEYALKDIHKPIGVSEYELGAALPETFRSSLPSIEDIEAELDGVAEA
jgi:predicted nuclease of restriction endonuclease-like (RecB) superfamily